MFRASSAHLQEDTVVYMQHMVLSLSTRVRGGLSIHSLSECLPLLVNFVDSLRHIMYSIRFKYAIHRFEGRIGPRLQACF